MKIIRDDFTPELCIVILFDSSAIPVYVFGLTGKIDPFLIAGFSQAVSSFTSYISNYLPDITEEKAIINNFINSGFYYRKFKFIQDNKDYAFIFRPIYNKLFGEDWISKILNEIVKKLEDADDIEKKGQEIFRSFNSTLFQEIKLMEYIREHEEKIDPDSIHKLIFRESGVRAGSLNDPKFEKIIDMIVNNFNIIKECVLDFDGIKYHIIKKNVGNNIEYFKLIIKKE